jgi:hypothetical protein
MIGSALTTVKEAAVMMIVITKRTMVGHAMRFATEMTGGTEIPTDLKEDILDHDLLRAKDERLLDPPIVPCTTIHQQQSQRMAPRKTTSMSQLMESLMRKRMLWQL